MTEPKRWCDDPAESGALRALLESFPAPNGLPSSVFARVRSHLDGADLGAPQGPDPCPGGALAGGKTASLAGLSLKLGTGALIVGGLALGLGDRSAPRQGAPAPLSSAVFAPIPPVVAPPRGTSAQTPSPTLEAPRTDAAASTPVRAVPETATRKRRPPSIREEAELLERARAALARAPHEAKRYLREYDARVRAPLLEVERTLLEIEVLAELGEHARAIALAERTLRAYPTSVYAPRVHALLKKLARDVRTEAKLGPAQSVGSSEATP